MKNKESLAEKLSDFKQELSFILRSTHALIEETESLNPDLIMGMLHTERKIISRLEEITEELKED
ncbi:hypothetical protein [Psychrosphaera aestuarii]|uniref:hypothetical protein n=1 Tax=Psychrosphaera aestuarii TaxID=1266052 RepID=UPI001B336259|nr:hypothetical protein [Psychrosphaera aestuarii]